MAAIPAGGTLSCAFDAFVAGEAGDPAHTDTVTATVVDRLGRPGTGSASRVVPFSDVAPSIAVSKTPLVGSVGEPGGTVTFSLVVQNLSVEAVTLTALDDDVFGDLLDPTNPAVANNTCPAQPAVIPVGGGFSCSFESFVSGDPGYAAHVDTVTAAPPTTRAMQPPIATTRPVAFTDILPAIAVSKTPSTGFGGRAGGDGDVQCGRRQPVGGGGHPGLPDG